jgi:hypothetical protein
MKITSVTISVPAHFPGNSIIQKPVEFDVFKEEGVFKVIPLLDEDQRRLANLPPELKFEYKEGKLVSMRGPRDGNLHVLQAIGLALERDRLL